MVRTYGEHVRTTHWWPWGPKSHLKIEENGAGATTTSKNRQQTTADEDRGMYTIGPDRDLAIKEE